MLVKWWLLAIPHYLVLAFLIGGAATATSQATESDWLWEGGLIGLLVLFTGVILLFTGKYPKGLHDLLLGLNRWVIRVAAYANLMTDKYPLFRLDLGDDDDMSLAPPAPAAK